MIESGEVIKIEQGFAFIRFMRASACGNCTACGMKTDQQEIVIQVENTNDVKVGDFVNVQIDAKKALVSSSIAYGFPLLMLIAGALIGSIMSELFAAILAIAFTVVAFLILKILDPVFKSKNHSTYKML